MEIVIATRNKKKVEEFKRILSDINIKLLSMDDFPSCPEVIEDGTTFEENAVKKALSVAKFSNKISVSDDSGLEVYALKGAPGIRSARYAGDKANDLSNIEKLLTEMKDIPDDKRGARFVCCIAVAYPDGKVEIFNGITEGYIGWKLKGEMGFGYDPIFYPVGYNRTFAEMLPEEKDALSHRGKALRKFKKYIKNILIP